MARFNATIKDSHAQMALDVYNLVNGGRLPGPALIVELGNLAANLIQSKANPQNFVPVGYKRQGDAFVPDTAPPGPTPPPSTDPEASFMARAQVGQNCAWGNLMTPAEQNWAVAKWGGDASLCVNAYAVGGANVMERPAAGGGYEFVTFKDGNETWLPDTGGPANSTADAYCAKVVAPNTLPAPLPKLS